MGQGEVTSPTRHSSVFQVFSQDLVSGFHQNLCQSPEFIFQYQIPEQRHCICCGSTRLVQNTAFKCLLLETYPSFTSLHADVAPLQKCRKYMSETQQQ